MKVDTYLQQSKSDSQNNLIVYITIHNLIYIYPLI